MNIPKRGDIKIISGKKYKNVGNYDTKSGAERLKWRDEKVTKYKVRGGYHWGVWRPAK